MTDPILPVAAMKERLAQRAAVVENWLAHCLDVRDMPAALRTAMYYSLLAGGKRLRPVLCLTTALMCGIDAQKVLPFAGAIEMIHTYSLIHDDLPAMDDDDLRRGKPSNHKMFDEATAILAGDALLTDAFVNMCSVALPAERVVQAVGLLATAAGSWGMVGGQVLDMEHTGKSNVSLTELQAMHAGKTGALLRASCLCGAILGGADATLVQALHAYGTSLGMAFQIADDILDVTADTATLGKPAGSDVAQGKCTYPSLLGIETSKKRAQEQSALAIQSLNGYAGDEAAFLRSLAGYVVARAS